MPKLLRPKWIAFHLLVIAAIVGMIYAGFWQLRRLDQRQRFNTTVEARYDAEPVPLGELLRGDTLDQSSIEWRPVRVAGEYLPDETILVVNRFQNGRAGDNVVVPVRLAGGELVLVNRGFVPLGLDVPDPPDGRVTLIGRLRRSEERRRGALSDPAEGVLREAQRVDIPRLTPQLTDGDGDVVLPMYVDVAESRPADASVIEPVIRPDLSEGPHRSYAIQWFIFSVCVGVGWVLAVRRSTRAAPPPTPPTRELKPGPAPGPAG